MSQVSSAGVEVDCLLLTGTAGAGKSAVAKEVGELMRLDYRRYGVHRLVLARVIVTAEELTALRSAIPLSRWTVCRLVASPDTIGRRLRAREPGVSQDFILELSRTLSAEMEEHSIEDFVVDNEGRSVTDVASEVLSRWRELA